MFFDDPKQIPSLAKKTSFSIFSVNSLDVAVIKELFPPLQTFFAPVKPENQKTGVDEARLVIDHCKTRQTGPHFVVFPDANIFTPEAQDVLLKLLEEPRANYHFAIFTSDLDLILETVRSRASIYVQKCLNIIQTPPAADQTTLDYAKRLLTLKPRDLLGFANDITSTKFTKDPRATAIAIVSTAVELAYKYYFSTKNPAFIKKLPGLIQAEQGLRNNGNVRLQLVARLL